jgi:hypothetical protein
MEMDAKAKALEMVQHFRLFQGTSFDEDGGVVNHYLIGKKQAITCAILSVDNILDVLGGTGVCSFADIKISEYWENVKKELQIMRK